MNNLTAIEEQIMPLILKGQTAKEIANQVYRTEAAIKWRKSKIFKKYKVKNSIELLALFTEMK